MANSDLPLTHGRHSRNSLTGSFVCLFSLERRADTESLPGQANHGGESKIRGELWTEPYCESSVLHRRLCLIVWGLSGPRGLSLPSRLMWVQMSAQLDLICSICLLECVCVRVCVCEMSHGDSPWFGGIWPLMCKPPAQLISTFCSISNLHLWQVLSADVTFMKISDLSSRWKSMQALLMNCFVSLVLGRQLPSIMVWSHGLTSRTEGF